ncbi:hypothetical protein L917_01815 [Phytophthora nicotianae]|uniref:Uncharacterized protein n=1 Tax=Phytophthora nicotianae TaxID=4792 RepID=W2LYB9_PHYNI|nr:hypothetical protein L917_01815 [Phytophthora nicotianae]
MYWTSWDAFYLAFDEFQSKTFQRFPSQSSTSIATRNKTISAAQKKALVKQSGTKKRKGKITIGSNNNDTNGGTLLPESWKIYSQRICVHTWNDLRSAWWGK